MKVTQEQHQALVDRLAAMLSLPFYDPATMVTAKDLAARMNVTKTIAEAELNRMVKRGQLTRIEVRLDSGKKGFAYVEQLR